MKKTKKIKSWKTVKEFRKKNKNFRLQYKEMDYPIKKKKKKKRFK